MENMTKKRAQSESIEPIYSRRSLEEPIPKYELSENEMLPSSAYNLIKDELMLDGMSRLNLATFVTTWMEPEAIKLIQETLDKNIIDKDEYPQTAEIEQRCLLMLAKLWNAPKSDQTIGCSTTGSSEAAMLAGMAMKWRWRARRKKEKKGYSKPNLVMGINVQICWEKFCRYWDVEMKLLPLEKGRYSLCPKKAMKLCDENTIGIIGILGSTFTGEYEKIEEIHTELDKLNKKTGWNIPLHVDAASGGFVAPFIQKKLKWDFRLKWVSSINASGHKYGLVYPGVGWVLWKTKNDLPADLVFNVNYLGGQMPTFALNFSRGGSHVIAQYYNFLRLGIKGYTRIHDASSQVAIYLAKEIEKLGPFTILHGGTDLPIVSWCVKKGKSFDVFALSEQLRHFGWQVPAYTLPENLTSMSICRIVVREAFSLDMANLLLQHMETVIENLENIKLKNPSKKKNSSTFHH